MSIKIVVEEIANVRRLNDVGIWRKNMIKMFKYSLLALGLSAVIAPVASRADQLDQIASPVSNPVNFEDPRIQSNLKPIFVYHKLDKKFVTGGGSVNVYALQARYAVNDRLAIIATKDGIVHLQPDGVLDDETGLANVGGGVKYAFFKDASSILTGAVRYEAPLGAERVLQAQGGGMFQPSISGAMALGCDTLPINLIGSTGFRFAFDNDYSSFYDASVHVDTKFGPVSPLFEVNLINVIDAGDRLPIADEGHDFFNFGSSLAKHKSMVTGAAGARVDLMKHLTWGAAYEFPLAGGQGTHTTDWRLTTDLTYTF